ncbi:MAG: hypothetical protein RL330_831 [Actinomycetota bacterium]
MNLRGTGRIVAGVVAVIVLLSGCGSGEEILDSTPGTSAPTTTSTSTSTVAGEPGPDCTDAAASAGTGVEMMLVGDCVDGWVAAMDADYAAECTECESVLLLRAEEGQWRVAHNCNQYAPLLEGICAEVTPSPDWPVSVATDPGYPSPEVACEIWDANTWEENLEETDCDA